MTARCSSSRCNAEIRWVTTTAGKPMPIDAKPNPEGNVELIQTEKGPRAVVHGKGSDGQGSLLDAERWMPHHATCLDDRWRKR